MDRIYALLNNSINCIKDESINEWEELRNVIFNYESQVYISKIQRDKQLIFTYKVIDIQETGPILHRLKHYGKVAATFYVSKNIEISQNTTVLPSLIKTKHIEQIYICKWICSKYCITLQKKWVSPSMTELSRSIEQTEPEYSITISLLQQKNGEITIHTLASLLGKMIHIITASLPLIK